MTTAIDIDITYNQLLRLLKKLQKFSGFDANTDQWYYQGDPVKNEQEYQRRIKLVAFE